ncbi:hypothetical protein [Massilia sp. CCM 8734]|uniref:hypothetical protein n=1 Tax=Massilia sp. CCM 8734 TaxID=2609283 RepID=UPI001420708E|nr:hypothetical protein [Massilia sp. CCM 8734]NHZ95830.1 hypothetical protein [Massilia sp. CCM 8734]
MTNPTIVAQHVTDVATTWWRRRREIVDVRLRFDRLADIDGAIDAHLDGLHEAGEIATELAEAAYDKAAGRRCHDVGADAFVVLALAFLGEAREAMDDALARLSGQPGFADALHGVLAWFDSHAVSGLVDAQIRSGDGACRLAALAHCHLHRALADGRLDDALLAHATSADAPEFDAIAQCGRVALLPRVAGFLDQATPGHPALFNAARCALLLGGRDAAIPALHAYAAAQTRPTPDVAKLLCVALSGSELHNYIATLMQCAQQRALAIQAAGWSGDRQHVPWLLAQIDDSNAARLAGESVRLITGLDLDANRMVRAEPRLRTKDAPAYPLPDRARLQTWWDANAQCYPGDMRYLLGRPVSDPWLLHVLSAGEQAHRELAALHRALMHPGEPTFPVHAAARIQQQRLERLRGDDHDRS